MTVTLFYATSSEQLTADTLVTETSDRNEVFHEAPLLAIHIAEHNLIKRVAAPCTTFKM